MFLCDQWRDYEVLDTGDGEKLERWGGIVLRRPDPQVIWPKADPALWDAAQATYMRSDTGGGHWEFREKLPDRWVIGLNNLKFYVKPTGFKHTGLFPEQAANWAFMQERIRAAGAWGRPPRVLNLFAYTGGATLACAAAGAHVTHVDAAKGMVLWARENRDLSGIPEERTRLIIEDAKAFVQARASPRQPLRRHPYGPAQLRPRPRRRGVEAGKRALPAGGPVRAGPVGHAAVFPDQRLHHGLFGLGPGQHRPPLSRGPLRRQGGGG